MINKLKQHPTLKDFVKKECSENDVAVEKHPDIKEEDIVIIGVDDYYNSLHLEKTPPSPDCLVVVKCQSGGFALTIVELKDISRPRGFDLKNMFAKFETCLSDFISKRFSDPLFYDYKRIELLFVSNIEVRKRDIGLRMEVLINKRYVYNGKRYGIKAINPTPPIRQCY